MAGRPADKPEVKAILARMDRAGALSRDDQAALACELGIGVSELPAQLRGGLLGIFFGDSEDHA